MKITHNKVGQNLNMVDGVKTGKADGAKDAKGARTSPLGESSLEEAGTAGAATRIDVSDRALEARKIKDLAKAAPDIDQEKVEKFRKLIDSGEYKVDAKAVADRMVDEHLESGF